LNKPLKILLVEDSEDDAKLVLLELRRGGYEVISKRVETAPAMEDALATQEWDVIISDYTLPNFSGLKSYAVLKSKGVDIPFIIVSGTIGEEVAVDAMKVGAHDYVMPAITREIQEAGIRRKKKQIERELYEREQRYRNLFENSPISLWEVNLSEIKKYFDNLRSKGVKNFRTYFTENPDDVGKCVGKVQIIDVNKTTLNLFEASSKTQMLENIQKVFIVESYPTFKEEIIALSEDPTTFEMETRFGTLTGTKKHVIIRVSIAPDYRETWERVTVSILDISERKRMEETLRKSEVKLKEANKLGRLGSWEFDIEKQEITWSDQTFVLYDRDPTLGPPTPEEEAGYYTQEEAQRLREYARCAIEEGKTLKYDFEASLPSDRHVFFSTIMKPIKEANDRIVKLFGTVQDITDRKLAEEQLRQTNQFLDSIIDNIPLLITVKNARTLTYQRVNRAFQQQTKMLNAEIVGKTAKELYSSAEEIGITSHDRIVTQSQQTCEFERGPTRTGRIYFIKEIPILNVKGEVDYLLSIADDVTKQREIERERQALLENTLQISDLKFRLITQTAHELKTPLTVITGWGEILYTAKKQGKSLDATFDLEDIASIMRSAERLNALINDFLDVGRIESGKFSINKESMDFSEIIESVTRAINYLATQKSISIKTVTAAPPVCISVDRQRMQQVLINLLSNAIKYSPEHTHVTLKNDLIETNGCKWFKLQVIDEGYGFTPEELAEATTPFGKVYTKQEQKRTVQGSGFGLFISRRIVEQHGGTLVIQSNGANQGTQVEILLPMD
jgi:signal transduction histidine kinase/CheY-like chemotaxis protein